MLRLPCMADKAVAYSAAAKTYKPMDQKPCSRATVTPAGNVT